MARKVIDEKSTVIFGIKPNYPETGFGYIQAKKKKNKELKLNVKQFLEKPKLSKAKIYKIKRLFFGMPAWLFLASNP